MFGWIKNKVENASKSARENELLDFLKILKGFDDHQIATLLLASAHTRMRLEMSQILPPHILKIGPVMDRKSCDSAALQMGNLIRNHQKSNDNAMAATVMIWAHSARALSMLELRPLGKLLWEELQRGVPFLKSSLDTCKEIYKIPADEKLIESAKFIPVGLEPDGIAHSKRNNIKKSGEKIEHEAHYNHGSANYPFLVENVAPPVAEASTKWLTDAPENVAQLYFEMQKPTEQQFSDAVKKNSIVEFSRVAAKYSAYSTASLIGTTLFFVKFQEGIDFVPWEKYNPVVYGPLLMDASHLNLCIYQYIFENHKGSKSFVKKDILNFLKKDEELPFILGFSLSSYLFGVPNAEYGYDRLKKQIAHGLEHSPKIFSEKLPLFFEMMKVDLIEMGMIGNPDDHSLFNHSLLEDRRKKGQKALKQTIDQITKSKLASTMFPYLRAFWK